MEKEENQEKAIPSVDLNEASACCHGGDRRPPPPSAGRGPLGSPEHGFYLAEGVVQPPRWLHRRENNQFNQFCL